MPRAPWAVTADGITLTLRLTPKGGRDSIDGTDTLSDGRIVLKVRVRAAPSEGEANDALIRLLAGSLGVPARSIAISSGAASRIKRVEIAGDGPALIARLEKLTGRA